LLKSSLFAIVKFCVFESYGMVWYKGLLSKLGVYLESKIVEEVQVELQASKEVNYLGATPAKQ